MVEVGGVFRERRGGGGGESDGTIVFPMPLALSLIHLSRFVHRPLSLTGWSLNVSPEELDVVFMAAGSRGEERTAREQGEDRCVDGPVSFLDSSTKKSDTRSSLSRSLENKPCSISALSCARSPPWPAGSSSSSCSSRQLERSSLSSETWKCVRKA